MPATVKVQAVIQARTGSKRLPNKVFLPLAGKPVLEHVYTRTKSAFSIDRVVIATTTLKEDEKIKEWCQKNGIYCVCGSETDVLSRFISTINEYNSEFVVRITADCPLIDPTIIDILAEIAVRGNYDYTSNVHPPTFPSGFEVEVIKTEVLYKVNNISKLVSHKEHVTLYIRENANLFKIYNLTAPKRLANYSSFRFTLDYYEDYIFLTKLAEIIDFSNAIPTIYDIISKLNRNLQITEINSKIDRFAGLKESAKLENRKLNLSYVKNL